MADRERALGLLSEAAEGEAERISNMLAQRKELKRQQQQLTREIKNESRKRQRLMQKARCLSESELLTVLGALVAKAKAKAAPKAAS